MSLAVLSLKPSLMMFRRQWSSCIHAILLWTGGLSTDLADYLCSVSGIQRPVMLSTDLCWCSINRVREHRRPHCLRIRGRLCLRQGYRICNLSAACLEQIGWKTFFSTDCLHNGSKCIKCKSLPLTDPRYKHRCFLACLSQSISLAFPSTKCTFEPTKNNIIIAPVFRDGGK